MERSRFVQTFYDLFRLALFVGALLGSIAGWQYLNRNGYIHHDKLTTIHSASWVNGAPYAESMKVGNRTVYRYMLPEYYGPSCIVCHGDPKGEKD